MRLATFNAAGIRARSAMLVDWLSENEPEILAIQETKVEDDKFPLGDFEDLGYHVAFHGQKGFNGVAILSREPLSKVRVGFGDPLWPEDCRILTAEIGDLTIVNTYVPNGTALGTDKFDYKLRWMERFRRFLAENFSPTQPLVWMGDMNVAPTRLDVYDPERHYGKVGFHPDEISRLQHIVDWGLTDCFRLQQPAGGHYTFWDFTIPNGPERNLGWRIDHIYATAPLLPKLQKCWIDKAARSLERPSDHTFVWAEFDLLRRRTENGLDLQAKHFGA